MKVEVPIGAVQQGLPRQGGDGEPLVAQGQDPVPVAGQVHDQAVPDGVLPCALRAVQVVGEQLAGKGPVVGLQAYHHYAAAVLCYHRVADIVVIGIEVEHRRPGGAVDGHPGLIAALLLRHRQIVPAVEPGGVVAQAPLCLHRALDAVLVQQVQRPASDVADGGLPCAHGELRALQVQLEAVEDCAVIPEQLGGVGADHQQAVPQATV